MCIFKWYSKHKLYSLIHVITAFSHFMLLTTSYYYSQATRININAYSYGLAYEQVADTFEYGHEPSGSIRCGEFLTGWETFSFLRKTVFHGVSIFILAEGLENIILVFIQFIHVCWALLEAFLIQTFYREENRHIVFNWDHRKRCERLITVRQIFLQNEAFLLICMMFICSRQSYLIQNTVRSWGLAEQMVALLLYHCVYYSLKYLYVQLIQCPIYNIFWIFWWKCPDQLHGITFDFLLLILYNMIRFILVIRRSITRLSSLYNLQNLIASFRRKFITAFSGNTLNPITAHSKFNCLFEINFLQGPRF
jgi:hypothetical protein